VSSGAAPAAGLLSAYGSLPWGTQILADFQQLDQPQIPASGRLRRTEAQPYSPKDFVFWNVLGMHRGVSSRLLHGKISEDHAVDLR
jgi:hypothetical protein